jgi:hypothetical protein
VLTLPCAAAIGASAYGLSSIFGTGALGPVVVTVLALGVLVYAFVRRIRRGPTFAAAEGV